MKRIYTEAFRQRFWAKVQKTETCWIWTASLDGRGYGQVMHSQDGAHKPLRAHRVAWELVNGRPIPEGLFLCHTCDVRRCVNPGHTFTGTNDDNVADMHRKGRNVDPPRLFGQHHQNAKLSNDSIKHIREAVRLGVTQRSLARAYGVHPTAINAIIRGRSWLKI